MSAPQVLIDVVRLTGQYSVAEKLHFPSPVDDVDTYKNIGAQVNEVRNRRFPASITGRINVQDDWDEFVEQIKRTGYDEHIEGLKQYATLLDLEQLR